MTHTVEYMRAYREANRERLRAYNKAYREKNRDKLNAYHRAWSSVNGDEQRRRQREQRGIIDAPSEARHGVCPICMKTRPLACDHDHETGRVRGWLCYTCNVFLGPTNEGRGARAAAYEAGELK